MTAGYRSAHTHRERGSHSTRCGYFSFLGSIGMNSAVGEISGKYT